MTPDPVRVTIGATVGDAIEALRQRNLSELPVVHAAGHLVGLIDVTDLIGLTPDDLEE